MHERNSQVAVNAVVFLNVPYKTQNAQYHQYT